MLGYYSRLYKVSIQMMHYCNNIGEMLANIFQLDQLPFLKLEVFKWKYFKDKEKYMTTFRSLSYIHQKIMPKIFIYFITMKEGEKGSPSLNIVTQKEICPISKLYQILNQNLEQKDFSEEVQKIKVFQENCIRFFTQLTKKNLFIFKKKDFLSINVYMNKFSEFSLKCTFNNYDYQINYANFSKMHGNIQPDSYKIQNQAVKARLYQQLKEVSSLTIKINDEINQKYQQFYQTPYFQYDEMILQLQIFKNYPLLRMKSSIPISFTDYRTKQPLIGPIFSNADEDCMYGHLTGYNANTIHQIQGQNCQICRITIEQFQQNSILTMLRDNVLNPKHQQIFYCPQYNRFKLLRRNHQNQNQHSLKPKISFQYLNFMHLRMNLKKLNNKKRIPLELKFSQQICKLTFQFLKTHLIIRDPVKGKYCQHYSFTDLRLYYSNFSQQKNEYKCPIEGCKQWIKDSELIYLHQVKILIDFLKFKSNEDFRLYPCAKLLINHEYKKISLEYVTTQKEELVTKIQQITDFYPTLINPYIPFAEYTLGIPDKKRKKMQEDYMFGAFKDEAQSQNSKIEEQMQREQDNEE